MDKDIVTMIGALAGAVFGLISTFWLWRDRYDRIIVRLGATRPLHAPTDGLFVINHSKHLAHLVDYGFVLENGGLFSLPGYWANIDDSYYWDEYDYSYRRGNNPIPSGDLYEVGDKLLPNACGGVRICGAFARTGSQVLPTVSMSPHLDLPKRISLWFKAKFLERHPR